jgi:hypothetical protein
MTQTQLKSPHPARDWPFQVTPLHPVLGCEILGFTLAQAVSPAIFAKVYEAFLDYKFHDVCFTPKSGHWFSASGCSLCAKSGHCRSH